MTEPGLPALYEIAARASINQRCALAYLHDIRGSMQALFSAVELLSRAAKAGGGNHDRIDKACTLAKRAIGNHEKSTLEALDALTMPHTDPATVDVVSAACEAVHFLRGHAAIRDVAVRTSIGAAVNILAQRARLQTLLVGLIIQGIDTSPPGSELPVSIGRRDGDAVVTIGSEAGFAAIATTAELLRRPGAPLAPEELILLFARQFLAEHHGRLEIDPNAPPRGALHVVYPALDGSKSLAAIRASQTEK